MQNISWERMVAEPVPSALIVLEIDHPFSLTHPCENTSPVQADYQTGIVQQFFKQWNFSVFSFS